MKCKATKSATAKYRSEVSKSFKMKQSTVPVQPVSINQLEKDFPEGWWQEWNISWTKPHWGGWDKETYSPQCHRPPCCGEITSCVNFHPSFAVFLWFFHALMDYIFLCDDSSWLLKLYSCPDPVRHSLVCPSFSQSSTDSGNGLFRVSGRNRLSTPAIREITPKMFNGMYILNLLCIEEEK